MKALARQCEFDKDAQFRFVVNDESPGRRFGTHCGASAFGSENIIVVPACGFDWI